MPRSVGKYRRIARILKGRIARGVYEERLPGEKALAAELKVDVKTVRSAMIYLEGQGFVRRVSRRGTLITVADARRRSAFVRLFWPGQREAKWATGVVDEFQLAAEAHGLKVTLSRVKKYADPDALVTQILEEATDPLLVGICVLTPCFENHHALALTDLSVAVVIVDQELDEPILPCVVFDDVKVGRLAAEHLVSLGHRRLGWLDHPLDRRNRRRGVEEVINEADAMLTYGVSDFVAEERCRQDLLAVLKGESRPTAFICGDDGLAVSVIKMAREIGLSVPRDLSVVCFMEVPTETDELTMVAMDHGAMGVRALELLLDEVAQESPRIEVIPVWLKKGQTTAVCPES